MDNRLFVLWAGVSTAAITLPTFGQTATGPVSPPVVDSARPPEPASFAAAPAPAAARVAAAASSETDIVVTGSRIARTTFETPTPVTTVSQKQLDAKAAATVVDLLRDVPALRPNQTQGSGRNIGVSTFNMRSLGATRTLVLLDGQRLMDTSPVAQAFDINIIPAPLVSRIDIVTAGVSSVYGSDAVTGVVNVILNNNLLGGRLDVQGDISQHGDQQTVIASAAYGTRFAEGRGKFVVAASFLDRPDILYQGERSWGRDAYTLVPNAAYTTTNGQYRQLIVPDARLSNMTLGGVITSAGRAQEHSVRARRRAKPVRSGRQRRHGLDAGRRGAPAAAGLWRADPVDPPRQRIRARHLRANRFDRGARGHPRRAIARALDQ